MSSSLVRIIFERSPLSRVAGQSHASERPSVLEIDSPPPLSATRRRASEHPVDLHCFLQGHRGCTSQYKIISVRHLQGEKKREARRGKEAALKIGSVPNRLKRLSEPTVARTLCGDIRIIKTRWNFTEDKKKQQGGSCLAVGW